MPRLKTGITQDIKYLSFSLVQISYASWYNLFTAVVDLQIFFDENITLKEAKNKSEIKELGLTKSKSTLVSKVWTKHY